MRPLTALKSLLRLGLLASLVLATSCAQDVGDIDRTQPNLLPKSMFEGQWFVRQTVIDVPPTSAFSFVGETGEMEVIRWEIQEDYLVGYRAYEKIPGADGNANHGDVDVNHQGVAPGMGEGRDPTVFKDSPIVAYSISSHVDVQREYNSRTGEQTNVISENTSDRPWYERNYIRVNWDDPLVYNFLFISDAFGVGASLSSYIPEDEGGADAFTKVEDPETGDVGYFDFTERLFVQPSIYGCILNLSYNEMGDCAAGEVKIRTSFLKVDEERERAYEPLFYDDKRHGEFGYFRTERPTYDRQRGVTFSGLIYLANRHDMWERSLREDGSVIPYAERTLRPIVYALSPNYPAEMRAITDDLARDFDFSFKRTAAARRGQSVEQLEADLVAQTGSNCLFCVDLNEDGHARIGDLRYSFIYWVDNPQMASPLGYGPSSAHPETGRIVAGMAYVYGAAVDTYATAAMDIVNLLNGDLSNDDVFAGDYVRNEINGRLPIIHPEHMDRFEGMDLDHLPEAMFGKETMDRINDFRAEGLPPRKPGWDERQLARIEGTPIESAIIDDELLRTFGHRHGYGQDELMSGAAPPEELIEALAPAKWATAGAIKRAAAKRRKAERNNLWLADFADPSIIGLARNAKERGLAGDALWQYLREQIYKSVMLHEIGHTVGLRHNFGASADALNYHDEYWPLRVQSLQPFQGRQLAFDDLLKMNCSLVTGEVQAACEAQQNGRMYEYQYSSIMDYGAKFNSDIQGLGKYDHAAIAAGYGELVEVFKPEVSTAIDPSFKQMLEFFATASNPLFGNIVETVHYTNLPAFMGSIDNMSMNARMLVPREDWEASQDSDSTKVGLQPLTRVPYIACFDEYRDSTATCHTWDQGADIFEISTYYIDSYREYYVFNNFQRDRVGFSPADVFNRVTGRYFLPMANLYQHWLFGGGGNDQILSTYAQVGAIAGFNTLWNVMSTPRYGSYRRDSDGSWEWYTYDQNDGSAELRVAPGDGRRMFSRYDFESGYYLFNRVLEAGYYYDQLGALIAITSSDASVIGIGQDVAADALAYSIPYNLVFEDDINTLFTGIFLEDFSKYGPVVSNGRIVQRDLLGGLPDNHDGQVQVRSSWSTRIRTLLYGMALLSSNYSLDFVQRTQISQIGSGEPITPVPGWEEVRLEDPTSGRIYVAYRDPADPTAWLGAEKLESIAEVVDQWKAMPDSDQNKERFFRFIESEVSDLEIMRGLYESYKTVF